MPSKTSSKRRLGMRPTCSEKSYRSTVYNRRAAGVKAEVEKGTAVCFAVTWAFNENSDGVSTRVCNPQFIEQAPGPRGSPQEPQGPGASRAAALELPEWAEKTESCRSSLLLLHEGHWGVSPEPRTSVSNLWSHFLQAYSKIGIAQD